MKIRLAIAVLLLAVLTAGCGNRDTSGPGAAGSPRAEILSYYPDDTPFVAVFATDPEGPQIKQALALIRRFAPGGLLLDQLRSRVSRVVDFDKEVRPLLGNPLALGAPTPTTFGENRREFLLVWMVKDAGKLQPLVDRLVRTGDARPAPDHLGAKVYSAEDGTTLAVRGPLVVFGKTAQIVTAALDRHAGPGHLDPAAVQAASGDLPEDALATGYGNVAPLLARPQAAKALRVPWVAALGAYAFALSADGQGLKVDFRLDTSRRALAAADLPLAAGADAPPVAAGAPVRVGVRDFGHLVAFAERAQALVDKGSARRFEAKKAEIRKATGVDLDRDVVAQLRGDATVTVDGTKRLVRAEVRDPAAMARTLARLSPKLARFLTGAGGGARSRPAPGGFHLVEKDGRGVGAYGLVGGELVAGNGSVPDLRALAAQPRSPVPGARGAVAFSVDSQLIRRAIASGASLGPLEAPLVLAPVGDVRGWLMGDPRGLRGRVSIGIG